jgi:hypothetical protein
MAPTRAPDPNQKLNAVEMRALSEPAHVAAERQKRNRFFEEKMVPTSGLDSNQRPSEAKEPSIEGGRLRACGTPTKEPFSSLKKMVPRVGLEPTLLSELDFESSASTNSTTGACF